MNQIKQDKQKKHCTWFEMLATAAAGILAIVEEVEIRLALVLEAIEWKGLREVN